jgi:predicted homoserine dehydrogenase-like protein
MGAIVTMDAVDHGKHIVMMNVECDVTIGSILRQMAQNAGVVYSIAAGDEPGSIMELYRFANAMGFEVVSAGKGKNNPLDVYATPDTVREKAQQRQMSPKMLCEFVDGSKTAVEMTAVSNMTGLIPDKRGMHGPRAGIEDIEKVFIPQEDGGVFSGRGRVDFGIGIHPGVFVVAATDNDLIIRGMRDRDMGPGPYYRFYRPYHLTSVEVPLTVAQGVIYGESTGHSFRTPVSEAIAVAKRDLEPGERLDRIGEYCYRGSIERADIAREERLLPLGLAEGCVVKERIPKDTDITYDMITMETETPLMQLRRLQDQLYWS